MDDMLHHKVDRIERDVNRLLDLLERVMEQTTRAAVLIGKLEQRVDAIERHLFRPKVVSKGTH
jgi:hypothetical protein